MTSVVSLKPAQALETTPAQAALEALEQAYAYYTPEPRLSATAQDPQQSQTELFDYYRAA